MLSRTNNRDSQICWFNPWFKMRFIEWFMIMNHLWITFWITATLTAPILSLDSIVTGFYLSIKNSLPVNQRRVSCDSKVESPLEEIQWFKSDSWFPRFKSGFSRFESHPNHALNHTMNRHIWLSLMKGMHHLLKIVLRYNACKWYRWIFSSSNFTLFPQSTWSGKY